MTSSTVTKTKMQIREITLSRRRSDTERKSRCRVPAPIADDESHDIVELETVNVGQG